MPFAATQDVAIRLGRALNDAEAALAGAVIADVTDMIAEAAGQDATWADALDPVPGYFKALCVEKAIAIGSNPNQHASDSETLGAHSISRTFRGGAAPDIFLTAAEERKIRQIVSGEISGSVKVRSVADDAFDALIGS